jgi:replicative DNA helicase
MSDIYSMEEAIAFGSDPLLDSSLFTWRTPALRGTLSAAGTLVVVGGRSGTGKSGLCLRIMADTPATSLYLSLEDPVSVVGKRAVHIDATQRQNIYMTRPKDGKLATVMKAIEDGHEALKPQMVVLDYIQLVRPTSGSSRTEELGVAIAELKSQALELGHVLVLASQLTRPQVDRQGNRAGGEPTMNDLRDSAYIENSAETILLLWQPRVGELRVRLSKAKIIAAGALSLYTNEHGLPTLGGP